MESKYENNQKSPIFFLIIFFLTFGALLFGAWQFAKDDFAKFDLGKIIENIEEQLATTPEPTFSPTIEITAPIVENLGGIYEGTIESEIEESSFKDNYTINVQEDLSFNVILNSVISGEDEKWNIHNHSGFYGEFDEDTLSFQGNYTSFNTTDYQYMDSVYMKISGSPKQEIYYKFVRKDSLSGAILTENEGNFSLRKETVEKTPTPTLESSNDFGIYSFKFPETGEKIKEIKLTINEDNTFSASYYQKHSEIENGNIVYKVFNQSFTGQFEDEFVSSKHQLHNFSDPLYPKATMINIQFTKTVQGYIKAQIDYLDSNASKTDEMTYLLSKVEEE